MNFYESLLAGFDEDLREGARLREEERLRLTEALMKDACCQVLQEIREVLDDDGLDDSTCFRRIEEIVNIYEKIGSDGGSRHDFG